MITGKKPDSKTFQNNLIRNCLDIFHQADGIYPFFYAYMRNIPYKSKNDE